MAKRPITLEELLKRLPNVELLRVYDEIDSGIVPTTGYSHRMCRSINRAIDKGLMCINPTTYRKVYLPTFARAVQKELASRFAKITRKRILFNKQYEQDKNGQLRIHRLLDDETADAFIKEYIDRAAEEYVNVERYLDEHAESKL
jgi:hypothetical protein